MRGLAAVLSIILGAVAHAAAPELFWQAALLRETPAHSPHYDAWLIVANGFAGTRYKPIAPGADFETTLNAVYAADPNPRISSIALTNVWEMAGLREQVVSHLIDAGELVPATAKKPIRWKRAGTEMRRIEALRLAILKSEFAQEIDRALQKRGKRISGVALEKVVFKFEENPPNWLAGIWLQVDR